MVIRRQWFTHNFTKLANCLGWLHVQAITMHLILVSNTQTGSTIAINLEASCRSEDRITFLLLVHDDDARPSQIRETISPKYKWMVTRSPLVLSSHSSSNRPEIFLSSSNLNKSLTLIFEEEKKKSFLLSAIKHILKVSKTC